MADRGRRPGTERTRATLRRPGVRYTGAGRIRSSPRIRDREIRDDASSLSQEDIRDYSRRRSPSQRSIIARLARAPVERVSMSMNVIDEEDELEIDPHDTDDPPRRPGLRRTTMGFELEFLLAVAPAGGGPDPHPGDGRWLCPALDNIDMNSSLYEYTVCNRIIDELRSRNMAARKKYNECVLMAPLAFLPFRLYFVGSG